MRPICYFSALFMSVPALLASEATEQDAYRRLCSGLREEVQLLSGIVDEPSAQSAVEPLRRVVSELAAMNDTVDENELWRYIDNTPDVKQTLIEQIELLFVQLQRLEEEQFYHSESLQEVLAPLLKPAS